MLMHIPIEHLEYAKLWVYNKATAIILYES